MSTADLIATARKLRAINSATDAAWIAARLYCADHAAHQTFCTAHQSILSDLFNLSTLNNHHQQQTALRSRGKYEKAGEGAWRAALMVMRAVQCGEREQVVRTLVEAVRGVLEERLPADAINDINSILELASFEINKLQLRRQSTDRKWEQMGNSVVAENDNNLLVTAVNMYVVLLRGWDTITVMLKSTTPRTRRVEHKPNDAILFCDTLPVIGKSDYARLLDDVNALSMLRSHDCTIYRL